MAKKAMGWLLMLLTVSLVGCDHATKLVAQSVLGRGRTVELVPGMLDLSYEQNHDTAFSLLRSFHIAPSVTLLALTSAAALIAVGLLWWRRREAASKVESVAYALVLAGAIGNVADRLMRGYVVDFIHLHRWPVFNVADILIVVGAAMLAFSFSKAQRIAR